jgi:uncharacterized protein (TIGR00369 family)
LTGTADRRVPYLPFCDINALEVLEVGEGRARAASTVGPWLEGAASYDVPAGAAALADMVLMYASSTRSTSGLMPVTASLRLDLWSPPPPVGTRLLGEAEVDGADGDVLLVRGRITAGERVVATATIRSMMVPVVVQPTAGSASPAEAGPTRERPKRPDRPSPHTTLSRLDSVLGLPAARLAGLDLVEVTEGAITLRADPDGDLERTGGVLHGGAVPLLATLTSSALLAIALPADLRTRRLDVSADYVRPTMIASDLIVRSWIVERSRRLVKIHSEVVDPGGRVTARVYETVGLEAAK